MRSLGAPLMFMLRGPDGNVVVVVEDPPSAWAAGCDTRPRSVMSCPHNQAPGLASTIGMTLTDHVRPAGHGG